MSDRRLLERTSFRSRITDAGRLFMIHLIGESNLFSHNSIVARKFPLDKGSVFCYTVFMPKKTFKDLQAYYAEQLKRRKAILDYYYGPGKENASVTARHFNISRERVRQIIDPEKAARQETK